METLLAASIEAARRGGVIRKASVQQVIVDTTVMPKAIAHPTDSRQHLVKAAENNGLRLRQNYNRVAPRLAAQEWSKSRVIQSAVGFSSQQTLAVGSIILRAAGNRLRAFIVVQGGSVPAQSMVHLYVE